MNISKNKFIILGVAAISFSGIALHVFASPEEGNLPHPPLVSQHQVFGEVVSVTQDSITIDPTDGPAGINPSQTDTTIPLNPLISVSGNENGTPIQNITDLTTGSMVQVIEDPSGNALRITVFPAPIIPVSANSN